MKTHYKLLITPLKYHLKPYKYTSKVQNIDIVEYGFLCFQIIITT